MKNNKKFIALLLSLNMLLAATSCSKKESAIDLDNAFEIINEDLDDEERNILLSTNPFIEALANYKLDTSNENRVKLVSEARNLKSVAKAMIAYKLNANEVGYSIEYQGDASPYVFSVRVNDVIYSHLNNSGPLYTLFNSCDHVNNDYNGDGSNREAWTDSVTDSFIKDSIDLYNFILLQSAYDYEIKDNKIVVSYESDNIKQYKKALN